MCHCGNTGVGVEVSDSEVEVSTKKLTLENKILLPPLPKPLRTCDLTITSLVHSATENHACFRPSSLKEKTEKSAYDDYSRRSEVRLAGSVHGHSWS